MGSTPASCSTTQTYVYTTVGTELNFVPRARPSPSGQALGLPKRPGSALFAARGCALGVHFNAIFIEIFVAVSFVRVFWNIKNRLDIVFGSYTSILTFSNLKFQRTQILDGNFTDGAPTHVAIEEASEGDLCCGGSAQERSNS